MHIRKEQSERTRVKQQHRPCNCQRRQMGASASNSKWKPAKLDSKYEKKAAERDQKEAIKEMTTWAAQVTVPRDFDSAEWRAYFEGQLKGRMGYDVSLMRRHANRILLERKEVISCEYDDDEVLRVKILKPDKISDAMKKKIRLVEKIIDEYRRTDEPVSTEVWLDMLGDEIYYEVKPLSDEERKFIPPTAEYNDQIASHLLDLMRADVVKRPPEMETDAGKGLIIDSDDERDQPDWFSLAFEIHSKLKKDANRMLRQRRTEKEQKEFRAANAQMSALLPDLGKIIEQFIEADADVDEINAQLGRGELTIQEMTAFVVLLWHCAFSPISDPFSPERIAVTGAKGTGNKHKRGKNGRFCGDKGKVCGALKCDLCWLWAEENKDGTLKISAELMEKLEPSARKMIGDINADIVTLSKANSPKAGIEVLQCKLACFIEDLLCEMGMEKVVPARMMDDLRPFARAKSSTDTTIVLSDTLRKSMTKEQLDTFDMVNRDHKAIAIAYVKPKEALPEIRLCTYLLLYRFAHENGFDFKQKAVWPKETGAKAKTATTRKKKKPMKG